MTASAISMISALWAAATRGTEAVFRFAAPAAARAILLIMMGAAVSPGPARGEGGFLPGPILARSCGECHADGAEEGGVSLAGVTGFADLPADMWGRLHEQVQLGLMPPEDATTPLTAAEREQLIEWIAGSLRGAGVHVENKLDWPNYGNYVPHEPLFAGPADPAPATLIRVWRRRPEVYAARNSGGLQPFSLLPGQQISDYAAIYLVDEPAAEIVLENAQRLAEAWTSFDRRDGKRVPGKQSLFFAPSLIDETATVSAEEFAKALNEAFRRSLDRDATPDEQERLRGLYDRVSAVHGRMAAARAVVAAPLLMPEAVFRLELGAGPLDEHGRRRLTKTEIIEALRQTLAGGDRSPEPLARARADVTQELADRDAVAGLVQQVLAEGWPQPQVLRFFDEYFGYRKAQDVFKEVPVGVAFAAPALVIETERLIREIVAADRDVLRRLLTTDEAWLRSPWRSHEGPPTHTIYNLPADFKWRGEIGKVNGPYRLAADERAGVLTQPAWLVAHSGNFDNDPVRRGKWILEHLLGGTVPDVPVTVCAVVPEDPAKTLRERFAVVTDQASCWNCHRQMNQLGMPFEVYDHFGRHRLRELGEPVDSSGAVVGIDDAEVAGSVAGPLELIRRLAESKRARQVFVRYAFRYFLGRNETLRDALTLREADAAFVASGGSMRALVTALLSSDSALYRTAETR